MSLPVPISDPQPPGASQERRWAGEGGTGRALPVWQLRSLAAVMAAFHAMGLIGFFAHVDAIEPIWLWTVTGGGVVVCASIAIYFTRAALRREPVSRVEVQVLKLLMLLPLVVNVLILVPDLLAGQDIGSAIAGMYIACVLLVLFACLPVLPLLMRFRARCGETDEAWTPHLAPSDERSAALLGLCLLVGGWTAFAGSIAMWAGDPRSVTLYHGTEHRTPDLIDALSFGVLMQPIGMILGFLGALIAATIPSITRTDRSVPLIFLPIFGAGVLGCLIDPLVGVCGAGAMSVVMPVAAWRTCRIIPPGRCQKCAYDLTDNATVVCPECGAPVASDTAWPFRT